MKYQPPLHHGGPVSVIRPAESSKRNRGLKQTNPTPNIQTKIIMRGGKPVMTKRLGQILEEIMASRAKLDAEQTKLSPGFRNQPPQAGRERPGSGGIPTNANRTPLQDPVAGEQDRVDERALSRAIGA